ncbi:MAG TPA: hemerythrin domain-containing protein [Bryobacteraceae bacterium]|nr:hemerythrin domain-containing protein [Bryobacteraceae bacterium]
MPILIGAKPESTFRDPIGLLTDCHRRIERFLSVLAQLGKQAHSGPLTSEQRGALETALRYFSESAPKHTADEEQTLFPRLRSLDRPEVKAVLANMDSLECDHAQANELHTNIDRLGRAWLASGSLSPEDAERFTAIVRKLEDLYRNHIALEEHEVFPVAAAVLERPQQEAMGSEMAARRGLRQS